MLPYALFRLIRIEPSVLGLQIFNLVCHLLAAILIIPHRPPSRRMALRGDTARCSRALSSFSFRRISGSSPIHTRGTYSGSISGLQDSIWWPTRPRRQRAPAGREVHIAPGYRRLLPGIHGPPWSALRAFRCRLFAGQAQSRPLPQLPDRHGCRYLGSSDSARLAPVLHHRGPGGPVSQATGRGKREKHPLSMQSTENSISLRLRLPVRHPRDCTGWARGWSIPGRAREGGLPGERLR